MATKKEKITEAAEHISASPAADGNGYIYHADETNEWWRVSEQDLIDLYGLLHDEDPDISNDAYSHWCSSTGELIGTADTAREQGLID